MVVGGREIGGGEEGDFGGEVVQEEVGGEGKHQNPETPAPEPVISSQKTLEPIEVLDQDPPTSTPPQPPNPTSTAPQED